MKRQTLLFIAVILGFQLVALSQTASQQKASTNAPPFTAEMEAATEQLVEKHDVNRNGKIDVQERKPYLHELSKLRQEENRRQAQSALDAPRIAGFPAAWDTNQDGKIDVNERRNALISRRADLQSRISGREQIGMKNSTITNQPPATGSTH